MTPLQRRIFRGIGYVWIGAGLVSFVFGFIGVATAIFGPEAQRASALGGVALSFGAAFANGAVGGGLLLATRQSRR